MTQIGFPLTELPNVLSLAGINYRGKTVTEVGRDVSTLTESDRCSLCVLLRNRGCSSVKVAEIIVTYTWNSKLEDILLTLLVQFQDTPNIVVWIDIFSLNQHDTEVHNFAWWSMTLKTLIQDTGRMTMILAPWQNPTILSRIWCVWEIYCAISCGVNFEFVLSISEKESFLHALTSDTFGIVNHYQRIVHVENSAGSTVSDQRAIQQTIDGTIGFAEINTVVIRKFREWIMTFVIKELHTLHGQPRDSKPVQQIATLTHTLGNLHMHQGKYQEAEIQYLRALQLQQGLFGVSVDHMDILNTMNSLGSVYTQLEEYEKAERFLLECFQRKQTLLSKEHISTLSTMMQLGILYQQQQKLPSAENLLRECLTLCLSQHGATHHYTLSCMMNLAIVCTKQCNYEEALRYFTQCVQEQTQTQTQNVAEVVTCMYHMATIYQTRREFPRAEELFMQCLARRKQLFGDDHPCVLNTMSTIAYLYDQQSEEVGKESCLEKAKEWYIQCYTQCKRIRGEYHKLSLAFLFNLALVYERQEEYVLAEEKYTECYEGRKKWLGEYHLDTIAALHGLADVSLALEKFPVAWNMFEICYDQHVKMLGESHSETLAAADCLKWLRKRCNKIPNPSHASTTNTVTMMKTSGEFSSYPVVKVEGNTSSMMIDDGEEYDTSDTTSSYLM